MASVLLWVGAVVFGLLAIVGGMVLGDTRGKPDWIDCGLTIASLALALAMAHAA